MKKNIGLCLTFGFAVLTTPFHSFADELPARKAGLWEVQTSVAGQPGGQTMKQCIDAATDAEMMQAGKSMSGQMGLSCAKNEVRKEGNDYIAESDCNMSGTRMISKTTFSGDFNSKYSGNTTTRYEPSMMGMTESKTTISARWLGACEPNQQPGDIVMSNGMKMNFKEMANLGGGVTP